MVILKEVMCDPAFNPAAITYLFFGGMALGFLTFTRYADLYGRKPIILISLCIQLVGLVLLMFVPNLAVASIAFFMTGTSMAGKFYVSFNYLIENQHKAIQGKVASA